MEKEPKQKISFFQQLKNTKNLYMKDQYNQLKKGDRNNTDSNLQNEFDELLSIMPSSERQTFSSNVQRISNLYVKDLYNQASTGKSQSDQKARDFIENLINEDADQMKYGESRLVDKKFLQKYVLDCDSGAVSDRKSLLGEYNRKTFELGREVEYLNEK